MEQDLTKDEMAIGTCPFDRGGHFFKMIKISGYIKSISLVYLHENWMSELTSRASY